MDIWLEQGESISSVWLTYHSKHMLKATAEFHFNELTSKRHESESVHWRHTVVVKKPSEVKTDD